MMYMVIVSVSGVFLVMVSYVSSSTNIDVAISGLGLVAGGLRPLLMYSLSASPAASWNSPGGNASYTSLGTVTYTLFIYFILLNWIINRSCRFSWGPWSNPCRVRCSVMSLRSPMTLMVSVSDWKSAMYTCSSLQYGF
ncbi:hypothetical protein [Methanobacterium virus PhiF1]|nr:hypothetical protein [Methanobacterium virus PhiF1]